MIKWFKRVLRNALLDDLTPGEIGALLLFGQQQRMRPSHEPRVMHICSRAKALKIKRSRLDHLFQWACYSDIAASDVSVGGWYGPMLFERKFENSLWQTTRGSIPVTEKSNYLRYMCRQTLLNLYLQCKLDAYEKQTSKASFGSRIKNAGYRWIDEA